MEVNPMLRKPILGLLILSSCTSGLVFGSGGNESLTTPFLEMVGIPVEDVLCQPDGELYQALEEIAQGDLVNQAAAQKVVAVVAKSKDPFLKRVQNSKHWQRFVALCNHNATKTATEFILALGFLIAVEFGLPGTAVISFALHLLGRFINKHLSSIPYLLRGGIVSIGGFFLFRFIDLALNDATTFDPFLSAAFILSGFLATENAVNAKPILNRPVGLIKEKFKDALKRGGWKFENGVDVNEFNIDQHIEVLIEQVGVLRDQTELQEKTNQEQEMQIRALLATQVPQVIIERLENSERRIQELAAALAIQRRASTSNETQEVCVQVEQMNYARMDSTGSPRADFNTPQSRQVGQTPNTSGAGVQEGYEVSGSHSPKSAHSSLSLKSGKSARSEASLEE